MKESISLGLLYGVFVLIAVMFVAGSASPCYAGEGTGPRESLSTVRPVERAAVHSIVAERPCPNFFAGALLGNGGLGVVVTTRPDAVMLIFGHNDVWDIRICEETKGKTGTFREVFERVKSIPDTLKSLEDDPWYRDYLASLRVNYDRPYPRPFPCGSVVLWFDRREAELLGHRLDISTGRCVVEFLVGDKRAHLEVFADLTADRVWARFLDKQGNPSPTPFREIAMIPDPDTPKELPVYTRGGADDRGLLSFRQIMPYTEVTDSVKYAPHLKDRAFSLAVRVSGNLETGRRMTVDGRYADLDSLVRRIAPASEFMLCVQFDRGLASAVPAESAVPEPSGETIRKARTDSERAWSNYWSKSGVALADTALERIWYRNLYFLRCALRPGATCPGLFANWSYCSIGTAWHGDYHLNYNIQQPFWATFSINHPELHLPYIDMIDHILPISKTWAKEYYGLRGAFFPHTAYPVDMNTMPYPLPHWGWEVFETPWAVQTLWWHYLYTKDRSFLEERAFGPMKEAALFLADYMKRPEAHGPQWGDDAYHIFPTVPPELYALRPGFDKNADTIADLTLTRYVFTAFTETCAILGRESGEADLLCDIRDILTHFPPYPTAGTPRGEVFVSVRGEDPEIVYNVPVSLMTVFPGDHHGLDSPPAVYRTALNTYRNQQNEGGNELVFLNVQAARLGVLDLERFKRQVEYCTLPNGTCADMVLQIHGRYTNTLPFDYMAPMGIWFENFSLPLVINECMLQSYNGVLRLFPNWPEGKEAEFRTLRAVGAFLVSAKRNRKGVEWIEVTSEAGGPLALLSPWAKGVVCERAGKRERITGESIRLDTKPGEMLRFFPAR